MCLAGHVPSPPHHPLGAVSECNDNIVFQEKEGRQRGPSILQHRSIDDQPSRSVSKKRGTHGCV